MLSSTPKRPWPMVVYLDSETRCADMEVRNAAIQKYQEALAQNNKRDVELEAEWNQQQAEKQKIEKDQNFYEAILEASIQEFYIEQAIMYQLEEKRDEAYREVEEKEKEAVLQMYEQAIENAMRELESQMPKPATPEEKIQVAEAKINELISNIQDNVIAADKTDREKLIEWREANQELFNEIAKKTANALNDTLGDTLKTFLDANPKLTADEKQQLIKEHSHEMENAKVAMAESHANAALPHDVVRYARQAEYDAAYAAAREKHDPTQAADIALEHAAPKAHSALFESIKDAHIFKKVVDSLDNIYKSLGEDITKIFKTGKIGIVNKMLADPDFAKEVEKSHDAVFEKAKEFNKISNLGETRYQSNKQIEALQGMKGNLKADTVDNSLTILQKVEAGLKAVSSQSQEHALRSSQAKESPSAEQESRPSM